MRMRQAIITALKKINSFPETNVKGAYPKLKKRVCSTMLMPSIKPSELPQMDC